MIALIEKYKTAGKRYTIAQSTFTYDAAWSGQVCELKNVASDSYWSSFVCELEISNIIPNYLTINTDSGNIFVTSTYPVASLIQLSIQLITGTEDDPLFMLTIEPGSSESDIFVYGGNFIAVDLKSISPASDDVYEYISNF